MVYGIKTTLITRSEQLHKIHEKATMHHIAIADWINKIINSEKQFTVSYIFFIITMTFKLTMISNVYVYGSFIYVLHLFILLYF